MLLKNVCFYNEVFEKEVADIRIENGKIAEIGIIGGEGRDMSGLVALPGFIDIHIHGGNGGDFSDGTAEAVDAISAYLAKHGVTSFCGTSMTLDNESLTKIVKCGREYMGRESGAKLVGINLEGPFISYAKKGAQNGAFVREGTADEFNQLYEDSGESVKIITIAPEAFESEEFIKEISKKCAVSIGHTSADSVSAQKAIDCGIKHATHLYNAMTPMTHREAGVVGTVMDNENVMCELICDGGHVCPTVVRNTFRILGEDRVCVISDSMRGAGLGAGEFDLGGQTAYVYESGKYAVLEDGTIAASITNVFDEFKNLLKFGIDFKTALKSCTINPARAIGLDNELGSIAPNKYADIIFVDENMELKEVYINGTLA